MDEDDFYEAYRDRLQETAEIHAEAEAREAKATSGSLGEQPGSGTPTLNLPCDSRRP